MYIITNLNYSCNTVLQSDFVLNIMRGIFHLFLQINASISVPSSSVLEKTDFCGFHRWAPLLSTFQLGSENGGGRKTWVFIPRSLLARLWVEGSSFLYLKP